MSLNDSIKQVASKIRIRVLEHSIKHNGGYVGQACSSSLLLASLYLHTMKLPPKREASSSPPPKPLPFPGVPSKENKNYFTGASFNGGHHPDFDRFYLSPAQYALVLYATLVEVGRMDESGMDDFNVDGSSVEMIGAEHSPGMEVTSGSLGQCLSQALGAAFARKRRGEKGKNFIFMSDGEFQIGMVWEAMQTAAHYKLDNVVVVVDVNGHQCDGTTTEVMDLGNLESKLTAFGAIVRTMDGHDLNQLMTINNIDHQEKPLVILCKTLPWYGLELFKKNSPKFHYLRFKDNQEKELYKQALKEMI